jgi:hypothetical protein
MIRISKGIGGILGTAFLLLLTIGTEAKSQVLHDQGFVHVVYLSPSDVLYSAGYESVLEKAVVDLQSWYAFQLNGESFSLAPDPVSWFQLKNPASFYQQKPGGIYESLWFWNSILGDGDPLVDWSFNDPDDIYIFYVDADPLPGQIIGGTSGVAMMAANDLRGLAGVPLIPINPGDEEIWTSFPSGPNRWIGGLGHELGHAFGLDHPGAGFDTTIMQFGYLYYPETTLADFQKEILLNSSFISADYSAPVPEPTALGLVAFGVAAYFFRWRWRRTVTG